MTTPHTLTRQQARRPLFYIALIVIGLISGYVAYLLIALVDVESVVATGPFQFIFGLFILIMAISKQHWFGVATGTFMIAITLLLVVLVNALKWSPSDAFVPFLYIGGFYLLTTTPVFIFALRTVPRSLHEWQCPGCGYLIYGLASPRCPECGAKLNQELVAKYQNLAPMKA